MRESSTHRQIGGSNIGKQYLEGLFQDAGTFGRLVLFTGSAWHAELAINFDALVLASNILMQSARSILQLFLSSRRSMYALPFRRSSHDRLRG